MPLASRSTPKFGSRSRLRGDPRRLGGEHVACGRHRVAADVVEPAAARRAVPHVVGVEQAVGEERLDRADGADRARLHEILRASPLRVMAHHESLGDEPSGLVARGDQHPRLFRVERDRLLAEHVLARLQRLDRPGHVQLVRQRIVDRLDLGVREQRLVGAVGAGDPEASGRLPRPRLVAGGDRRDVAALRALHRRNDLLRRDPGDAEHAPFDLAHDWPLLMPSDRGRGLPTVAPASSRDIPASRR